MASSEPRVWSSFVALALLLGCASRASAQQDVGGFAIERLYTSPAGAGWVVMDALDMHGGFGGAAALSLGYAHDPLRVASADGSQRLDVVRDQAFAGFGFAATYDRFRLSADFRMPIVTRGQSGVVDGFAFHGPSVDPGSHPDRLSDARIGFEGRLLGEAASAFRLGFSAQLLLPSGDRCDVEPDGTITNCDYETDATYRGMVRVLFAGDVGRFTYAGHLGVHLRPIDDAPAPGTPRGSELLFGVAAGAKVSSLGHCRVVLGPELFGATAFRSFFASRETALETLLAARLEGTGEVGPQFRIKLGAGAGIPAHFGAPEWRIVFGIEAFARYAKER